MPLDRSAPELDLARVAAGLVDGGVQVQLVLQSLAAQLSKPPQRHLDLPGVQDAVVAVSSETPLCGNADGAPCVPRTSHSKARGMVSTVSEGGRASGADPLAPSVVGLLLLPEPLLEHLQELVQAQLLQLAHQLRAHQLLVPQRIGQPVPELAGQIKGGELEQLPSGADFGLLSGTYAKAGEWTPGMMSEEKTTVRFDITPLITQEIEARIEWEYGPGGMP